MSSSGLPRPLVAALAALQLALTVGWLAYAVSLPPLIAAVGLPRSVTPWVLLRDQALFVVLDLGLAFAAGPLLRVRARAMPLLLPAAALSTVAMLLLPAAAGLGRLALGATLVVWVVATSALRAPIWALFARHVPPARRPLGLALGLAGVGLAAAAAPYAAAAFKAASPLLAFGVSGGLLIAASLALLVAERAAPPSPPPPRPGPWTLGALARLGLVAAGAVALALGAQLHSALRVGALVGAVLPADAAQRTDAFGGAAAAVASVIAGLLGARLPPPLLVLLGACGLSLGCATAGLLSAPLGVAAGVILAAGSVAFSGAAAVESAARSADPGREGLLIGVWSAATAGAAALRLGLVASGVAAKVPGPLVDGGVVLTQVLAGGLFLGLLVSWGRRGFAATRPSG